MPENTAPTHSSEPYQETKGEEYMNEKQQAHFREILNAGRVS